MFKGSFPRNHGEKTNFRKVTAKFNSGKIKGMILSHQERNIMEKPSEW